jgi:hypothetical protein
MDIAHRNEGAVRGQGRIKAGPAKAKAVQKAAQTSHSHLSRSHCAQNQAMLRSKGRGTWLMVARSGVIA